MRQGFLLLLVAVSIPFATADTTADFTRMDDKDLVLENGTLLMNSTTDYAVGNYNLSEPLDIRAIQVEATFPGNSSGQMTFYTLKDTRNAWLRRNTTRQGFTSFRESGEFTTQQSGIEAIQISLFRNNATQTPKIESVEIIDPTNSTSTRSQNTTTSGGNLTDQTTQPTALQKYRLPIVAVAAVTLVATAYLLLRQRN